MHRLNPLWVLSACLLAACLPVATVGSDEEFAADSEFGKYEAQLNAILRTRLDEEKAFVHETLVLVRMGKLPRQLVDRAAVWVRHNNKDRSRGFVYFERVLRLQANRLGFEVPPFDYRVYDRSNRATMPDASRG